MNTVLRLCGIATFLVATITNGADIYVSPTGNDAAAGTIEAPLATLAAARDKADLLKANNTPVAVYLRGGTYYLSTPVVFGPANSGTATAPIVYTAFPGEKPVISGGIKVTSAWAASSGSIMVTTIAQNLKVDQLFLNGKRQVMARFPNFNANTVILDGYDANCLSRVGNWSNPGEGPGYIRGLHNNMWGGNSYKITGKSGTSLTQVWVGDNNRGNQLHATYRMVENIFEELDAAGEWFYRKSTGQLFFWPPAGTNLSTSIIELASQDELLRFVGSAAGTAGSVKYVQFNGVTLTHTFRTLFSKTYEPLLKSDWCIARAGTVFMQNAENIVVRNCLFDQIGGNGIFVSGYNRNHVIFNNTFIDAGASCVALIGLQSAVRCPGSWASDPGCNDRTPGPLTEDYPAFITVNNNTMNHFGRFEKQTAGVANSMSQCDTIRHNSIHDCPRVGITINDGCWGGHVIEYNWIYKTVLETGDHGPFNAWGRDRNTRWPNDTSATTLDAWKTTVVRNNRIEPKQGDFGLDMDDDASNYYAYNNLIFGGGIKFIGTMRKNTYVNNILLRDSQVKVFGGQITSASNFYMTRNIIANSQPYQLGSNTPDYFKQNTRMVDSNFYSSAATQVCGDQCFTWAQWHAAGLDAHSVLGIPTFADTAKVFPNNYAPRGDYNITSAAALALGFKSFPMDSFGVVQVPPTAVRAPAVIGHGNEQEIGHSSIYFNNGRLAVSHSGNYQVRITMVNGRTVAVLHGINGSVVYINTNKLSPGMYFAVVATNRGSQIKRFIVNE
jgi:hypothetical protein